MSIVPPKSNSHMQAPMAGVDAKGPLLVIGAGFGRTGTMSLKTALEMLYGHPCYHLIEVVLSHPDHVGVWTQIFDQLFADKNANIPDELFKQIFADYRTTVANPSAVVFDKLMKIYPDAKIILSTRNADTWAASVSETIVPIQDHFRNSGWAANLLERLLFGKGALSVGLKSFQAVFGPDFDFNNREKLVDAFNQWNQHVIESVPEDRLLIFQASQGWAPLCRFLDLPEPNRPYPRVNERDEMKSRIRKIKILTTTVQLIGFALFGAVVGVGAYCTFKRFNTL